ncbi:MAG: hypothetical protein JO356_02475 [Acidobacteria bacterium]|nr:hypothetical protein [Acidobacteriota bacterium]
MIALRLVRLVEAHSDKIARDLLLKIQRSSRTRELHKVHESELLASSQELLEHLSEWLLTKTKNDVEVHYRAVGARLMRKAVPLADACWAVIITKEYLWDFLQKQGLMPSPIELYGEMELLCLLDHFFDRALCHLAEGYEQEQQKTPLPQPEPPKRRDFNLATFAP